MKLEKERLDFLCEILCKECFDKVKAINEETFRFGDQDGLPTEPCDNCAMSLAMNRKVEKEAGVWTLK